MKIEKRNKSLKSPRDIKHDKMKIILDWLLEFRFSSVSVLAETIEHPIENSRRFFNLLIRQGIIKEFRNQYFKEKFVMLTVNGVEFLELLGRDTSHAIINADNLKKTTQLFHHLEVQKSILRKMEKHSFTDIIWDQNVRLKKQKERPDALLKTTNGYWVALEVERRRKDDFRVYSSFCNHINAINRKHYDGIYYVFNFKRDYLHYNKLLNKNLWPKIIIDKEGRPKKTNDKFEPPEDLRKRFVLFYEPLKVFSKVSRQEALETLL